MSIRDILLHLDPSIDNQPEIKAAVDLSLKHQAHLAGLTTVTDPAIPVYGFTGFAASVYQAMDDAVAKQLAAARTAFTEALAKTEIPVDFRATKVQGSEVSDMIALHGRHADLVVMRQSSPDVARAGGREVVEETVLTAGRPVLTIPYAGEVKSIGTRVLLGWDGSREAARALGDALPLMRDAEDVHVMVINPKSRGDAHGELPGADISTHLARHGLKVNLMVESTSRMDPANLILSRAADLDCDLLVMGAFAHSRLQQSLFGGVTRSILEQMTVPVLLSH